MGIYQPNPRIAVIGAGAAGITAIKELLERGIDVVGFEKGNDVGGLWVYENSSGLSPAYKSLHLNTSKGRTQFADFPMPADWVDYPAAEKVANYLRAYADEFGVTDKIRFNSPVAGVDRHDHGWTITLTDGTTEDFDGVVVANGHNWDAKWPAPEYPGHFAGKQMHAHDYRTPEVFANKRVLVVGMGNSAMDISVDASYVASDVLLSARHGSYIVPKYLFGRPADATNGLLAKLPWRTRQKIAQKMLEIGVGKPQSYGLHKPSFGLFQNHPTISDTILHRITHGEVRPVTGIERFEGERVVFTDGTVKDVDVIVWATGYRVTIPFLDSQWLGNNVEDMRLYKRVFHLDDPTLTFVGLMQSTGAALPVVEAQSKLVAAYFANEYSLPSEGETEAVVQSAFDAAVDRWGNKRPAMRIDFDDFIADVPKELKAGRRRTTTTKGRSFTPIGTTRTAPRNVRASVSA